MKIQITIRIFLFTLILFNTFTLAQSSFQGLGDLPGGTIQSFGTDVSADGSVIVGKSSSVNGTEGFRWTEGTGMLGIGDLPGGSFYSPTSGTSEDGSVIVGLSNSLNGGEAFRWTSSEMVGLGDLPGGIFNSWAVGVSSDGSVVAGIGKNQDNEYEAFRWTNANGMVGLGNIPGGDSSWVWAMSNDGNVIVGTDRIHPTPQTSLDIAFRWTPASGMQPLNPPSGFTASHATGISGDGIVIIGYLQGPGIIGAARWTEVIGWVLLDTLLIYSVPLNASLDGSVITGGLLTGPFIWDQNNGIRNLRTVFEQDYGLDLTEWWSLVGVDGISDDATVIIGTGTHIQGGQPEAWRAVLPKFVMVNPQAGERWIAGEKDTIRWNGGISGQFFNIEFSTDSGVTYSLIAIGVAADSGNYIWSIPQNILSTKVKIKISDFADSTTFIQSETFKIKPYIITRLDENNNYVAYSINTDRWGFSNAGSDVWPRSWFQQFNYRGTDPFTNQPFPNFTGFNIAPDSIHPDWVSWVRTFGINACYVDVANAVYNASALVRWQYANGTWGGSCFGIAISNALVFQKKNDFLNRYPNFPNFANPINVTSSTQVIPVINELFSHQFGNPHKQYRNDIAINKTPNQTLNDLKQMLSIDSVKVQTLSFLKNPPGSGGHAILAYKVEKNITNPNIFYVFVYDNSYPDSTNARITINTTANGGNGSWSFNSHWPSWGGNKWIYLRDPAENYLSTDILPQNVNNRSAFILADSILQIYTDGIESILLSNNQGQSIGFFNSILITDLPDAYPFIIDNGNTGAPKGYHLLADNYSILMNDFKEDALGIAMFSANKSFVYERSDADSLQTDRLFFDGGISVTNPDQQVKNITLTNIINETIQEKVFIVSALELIKDDSVKITNPNDNSLDLISYGLEKNYQIELNFPTQSGMGRFLNSNIALTQNTTHKLVPNWEDFTDLKLTIYIDEGNNGSIDDTIEIQNQVTGVGEDQGSLIPTEYHLAQNFPNPFNPSTTIKYSIPKSSLVVLKIYDVLGNEVATLVSEEKAVGSYEVKFNAIGLSSGIYFYKLQSGSFVETKKMILMK